MKEYIKMKTIALLSCCALFISCNNGMKNKAEYSGEDISQNVHIVRDQHNNASIEIPFEGEWYVYAGSHIDDINFSKPVLEGKKSGIYPLQTNDTIRDYYVIKNSKGQAIIAERRLPLQGTYNVRDMGGYKNKDGCFVKWGKVFRADNLSGLTGQGLTYLKNIPLRMIVDFRSEYERSHEPDKIPSSVNKAIIQEISLGNLMVFPDMENMTDEVSRSKLIEMNKLFVSEPAIIQEYKRFFELLQDENMPPLLFHCSAGKDRTGLAAALFLYSLGVNEETIMYDYGLTSKNMERKYAPEISKYPDTKSMYMAYPEYLQAALNLIKQNYGSVEDYLKNILNVDIEKMKGLYLYNNL